jgi:hypothetical protein
MDLFPKPPSILQSISEFDEWAKNVILRGQAEDFLTQLNEHLVNLTQLNEHLVNYEKYVLQPVYNVKGYGAKVDGSTDDTQAILNAIDDASISGGKVLIPGPCVFNSTLIIPVNVELIGLGAGKSKLILQTATDGIYLRGLKSGLSDIEIQTPPNYAGYTALTVQSGTNGHSWEQRVRNFKLTGADNSGIGLKIQPLNNFGIMNCFISLFRIYGYNDAVLFDMSGGWTSGGTIFNGWQDNNVYGVRVAKGTTYKGPSSWSFINYHGQYTSGISQYHLKDIAGINNQFINCRMWDGGIYALIDPDSKFTVIENHYVGPTGTAENHGAIIDRGYRTRVTAKLNPFTFMRSGYFEIIDHFLGGDLLSHWTKTVSGTGTISQILSPGPPYIPCVELATGTTSKSVAKLNWGGKTLLNRYGEAVLSCAFKLPDGTDSINMFIGFENGSGNTNNCIGIRTGTTNFEFISIEKDISQVIDTGITLDTNWHYVQIIIRNINDIILHFDENPVATLNHSVGDKVPQYNLAPFLYITNTSEVGRRLLIADFYLRGTLRFN